MQRRFCNDSAHGNAIHRTREIGLYFRECSTEAESYGSVKRVARPNAMHSLLHRFDDNRGLQESRLTKKTTIFIIACALKKCVCVAISTLKYVDVTVQRLSAIAEVRQIILVILADSRITKRQCSRNTGERVNRLKFCIIWPVMT